MILISSYETLETIEEHLRYNYLTGNLHWRVFIGSHRPGDVAGYVTEAGYKRVSVAGKAFFHHIICWFLYTGSWPDDEIDHINRIRSDNRIDNLREVDRGTNQHNTFSSNASGARGVYVRGKHFVAKITFQKKSHYLGTFQTLEEAASMYSAVAEELYRV